MRATGAPWGLAYVLNIRGMLAQLQGDYAAAIPLYRECTRLSRALRDTTALYFELAALAGALAMTGRDKRAAQLFGAAEALHERTGAVMTNPASRDLYARHLAALRARLDAATLAREWAAGRAMSLDEAIATALEDDE